MPPKCNDALNSAAPTSCSLALRGVGLNPRLVPEAVKLTTLKLLGEGFSHFVTSMTAPVASGWSDRRVGLAPTGKRRLTTAHTLSCHSFVMHLLDGATASERSRSFWGITT